MKYVLIGLVIVLVASVATVAYAKAAKASKSTAAVSDAKKEESKASSNITTTKDGLVIEEIKVGSGKEALDGKKVSVHYTGTLLNGKKFDSSRDRNQAFEFSLGAGQVIKGWDQGVKGMKIGGKRKLTIPAALAYGDRDVGNGLIPAGSTLMFDVELLKVE
jgi:FKBP-type peptidyl-prolyl cis-trans isomerase FkpA